MSEIPKSIKRAVLNIYADHWERGGLIGEAEELRRLGVAEAMRNMDEKGWFDLIARALMAEREACEAVARARMQHLEIMQGSADDSEEAAYQSGKLDEAGIIAAAIRNR